MLSKAEICASHQAAGSAVEIPQETFDDNPHLLYNSPIPLDMLYSAPSSFDLVHKSPDPFGPSKNTLKTFGIEMTCPLTSTEEDSTRFLKTSREEMSSFQSARERTERLNAGRNNTTPSGAGTESHSTPRPRAGTYVGSEASVPLSAVAPGPVYPTETQLGLAYGYGIRREDGTITRLLRADQLEELDSVPKSQGPEGLIILPPTRQLSPRCRQAPDPMIAEEVCSRYRPSLNLYPLTGVR